MGFFQENDDPPIGGELAQNSDFPEQVRKWGIVAEIMGFVKESGVDLTDFNRRQQKMKYFSWDLGKSDFALYEAKEINKNEQK